MVVVDGLETTWRRWLDQSGIEALESQNSGQSRRKGGHSFHDDEDFNSFYG